MALTVGVPKETAPGERLVAQVPEVTSRFVKKGMEVLVESGAGEASYHSDAEYESAGAKIVDRAGAFGADIVLKVQPPDGEEIALLHEGSILVSFLQPLDRPEIAGRLAERGVTAISMELVPRISRAQTMDALSALSSVGGYKATIIAAEMLPKFLPLLTTAAGTVRPANVLVLGAGVAGLQAIATAKRLGARVSGYDIREAAREEVQSLGATFVDLPIEMQEDKDSGGYAKALEAEKAKQQTKLLVPFIAKSDVVITTALIPGRRAPILITEEAVHAMQPGSVIIDMAARSGGNCELTKPDETVEVNGVRIVGPRNLPSTMAVHASQLYSRTLMAMVFEFVGEEGFRFDFEDEILKGACVTYNGEVVNERVKSLLAGG